MTQRILGPEGSKPRWATRFHAGSTRTQWRRALPLLVLAATVAALVLVPAGVARLAANPAASLDQCANDPAPSPSNNGCATSATQWVNGNLGASKSVYNEGDSIPYRLTFSSLSTSITHSVTIEWDTTKSGKHAIDYITTVNRSVLDANPCLLVTPCSSPSTRAIPKDPQVDDGTSSHLPIGSPGQAPGVFTLYGGTITGVSAPTKVGSTTCTDPTNTLGSYCYSAGKGFTGDKSAAITIEFTATQANPVLAWGGHIAQRRPSSDSGGWGDANAAVTIPGSPYHTRLVDLDGSGGNQDRSLSADAVIFPGSIHVVKNTNGGDTTFPFTASPTPLANCSITTSGGTGGGPAAANCFFDTITTFQTYTINETPLPSGWAFDTVNCTAGTSANGGSVSYSGAQSTIVMKEGENWTCAYANHHTTGSFKITKSTTNLDGATLPAAFTGTYDCGTGFTGTFSVASGASQTVNGVPTGNTCSVVETAPAAISGYTWGTPTYTPASIVIATTTGTFEVVIGNSITRDKGSLVLAKSLTGGPAGFTGPFTIHYDCGTGFTGDVTVDAGSSQTVSSIPTGTSCTVSEPTLPSAPAGYSFGTPTFSPSATVTIPDGSGSSVTVTTNNTLTPNTPTAQILPTATTCQNYVAGATSQGPVLYGVKGNPAKINNVSPGVVFYYNTITAPSSSFDIHVTQSNNQPAVPLFGVKQVILYNGDCTTSTKGTVTSTAAGDVIIHVTGVTAGQTFIYSVKYDPTTVSGSPVPSPTTVNYSWSSHFNSDPTLAGSTAGVALQKK